MKFEEIKGILEKNKDNIRKKFKVKEIELFGSYVRGEQRKESDIDILVEFEETPTLLEFVELEKYFTELLGVKIDLVMKRALKPKIKEFVLKEVLRMRTDENAYFGVDWEVVWLTVKKDIPKIKLNFENLLREVGGDV